MSTASHRPPGLPSGGSTRDSETSSITIRVNGRELACTAHLTLAAALLNAGVFGFRSSVQGHARGPVCGMGTCFECRVTVDGVPHVRACMRAVRDGMDVRTGDSGQRDA